MAEQPAPSESHESSVTQNVSGGVTVQPGSDANVSGDFVGRDKVTITTLQTNSTSLYVLDRTSVQILPLGENRG